MGVWSNLQKRFLINNNDVFRIPLGHGLKTVTHRGQQIRERKNNPAFAKPLSTWERDWGEIKTKKRNP
jgi:hypothetical protein